MNNTTYTGIKINWKEFGKGMLLATPIAGAVLIAVLISKLF